ncbi:MAG: SseB family protein [Gammaproteobacteria bacterium]|nr:SseB family protein [Gammaproteobacteria bacterium]
MNQLEQHLELAIKDPKNASEFFKSLVGEEIFCLGQLIEDEHAHNHAEGEGCDHDSEVSIVHWEDESGNSFVPFFTSLDAMTEVVGEDEHYLCVLGFDFLALTEGETLLLNPETDQEWSFSPEEVSKIISSQGH